MAYFENPRHVFNWYIKITENQDVSLEHRIKRARKLVGIYEFAKNDKRLGAFEAYTYSLVGSENFEVTYAGYKEKLTIWEEGNLYQNLDFNLTLEALHFWEDRSIIPGVYILYSLNEPVYVGYSADLRRRSRTSYENKKRANVDKMGIIATANDADARILEQMLIAKYRPPYNRDKSVHESNLSQIPAYKETFIQILENNLTEKRGF